MNGTFFNVSGIDPNDSARAVFVWCRDKDPDKDLFLGSGHLVNVAECTLPPGIKAGQFSVTFLLPHECSACNIVVTDDTDDTEPLPNVTVTRCADRGGRLIFLHPTVAKL
jgi:hypothetical protein